MIELEKLNGEHLTVNALHIVFVEEIHDTLLTLTTGEKIAVHNSGRDVVQKVTDFLRSLGRGPILTVVPAQKPVALKPPEHGS